MKINYSFAMLLLLTALTPITMAAEKGSPVGTWVEAEKSLIESLSKEDQETFFILRNKHSVIRSLEIVRDDIAKAVKGCGKGNKQLQDEMKERFKEWENAVLPILEESKKFVKVEITEQTILDPSQIKKILKLNDAAYKYTNDRVEKIPLNDEKSCQKLLKSMDKTEDKLIQLLQNILLPEEVVRERIEQDGKKSNKENDDK